MITSPVFWVFVVGLPSVLFLLTTYELWQFFSGRRSDVENASLLAGLTLLWVFIIVRFFRKDGKSQ